MFCSNEKFRTLFKETLENSPDIQCVCWIKGSHGYKIYIEFVSDVNYYEYEFENGYEYEISYYYFTNEDNIFLCKFTQYVEDGSDSNLDFACIKEKDDDYEMDISENTIITKREFDLLYKKLRHLFEINTLR